MRFYPPREEPAFAGLFIKPSPIISKISHLIDKSFIKVAYHLNNAKVFIAKSIGEKA